ncbi:MAG TPA: FkbM family methyltransferase [Mucilaginibacter sp.]|nr:FkbM family methyltransferase [Mucilaginibacter sp.]
MFSLKKIILKYFPVDRFLSLKSYSQEGEDMVLRSFFEGKKHYKGYYIDVGAHHPYRFSNTLFFYNKGWKGINIEPTPGAIKSFNFFRRRDINLNIGISSKRDKLTFYCFNEPALNGFSKELSEERSRSSKVYKIIEEKEIETYPLAEVLDKHLPQGQKIDFFSIDVEGLDLQVLKSNNWDKYKPAYILVEDKVNFTNLSDSEVYTYLEERGYEMVAKTMRTLFFKLK